MLGASLELGLGIEAEAHFLLKSSKIRGRIFRISNIPGFNALEL